LVARALNAPLPYVLRMKIGEFERWQEAAGRVLEATRPL
jgi:hypothetical protein